MIALPVEDPAEIVVPLAVSAYIATPLPMASA